MKRLSHRMRFGRAAIWLLGAILLMNMAYAETADLDAGRRTVRVAFPSQSGMSGVGASGDLVGYNYDYLQKLAEYAGWKLEYLTYEDMSANDGIMSAMQMVMNGEADLLGPMLKSDAVEEMFDFPQDNYGVVYTTLCALEKSNITSVNYTRLSPVRVAIYAAAETRNQEVTDYLTQQGVSYVLLPCETSDEQLALLQSGEADLLSSITLSYFDGTRSVAQFAPRPYYFVTTKGNTELLSELDEATAALNYSRPYLQQQLQEKYFGDTSSGYVLTPEEMQRMEELETLKVLCASESDAPYVCRGSDGEPAGMMVALLDDFAKINNLQISYTFCEDQTTLEAEWGTGTYDCMIGLPLSSDYCSTHDLIRTEAVTTVDLVLFARQSMTRPLAESTVAVYSRLADQINADSFGSIITFDRPDECYEAVENGLADYGCSDRLITEYTLFERDSPLVTLPLMGEREDISIAVSRFMGNEFLSALNKFIHTLSDSTKTTYLTEGSRHTSRAGLSAWIHDHPFQMAAIVSGIILLLAGMIMFAFYASRIRRKNRQLEKANAAKSEFLARMSHDIRTPMNAILGYLAIARETGDCPERVVHCIDNSDIAARHLLQLINDVLDMSSIESGKIKIASEEFDLKAVISDAALIFHQTARAKGVRFEVQINGLSEEWVTGDALRVNQIVMNLLSNAVKFTPEDGRVRLSITQIKADSAGSDVQIMVSDTGIGMSEEYMQRLFQPFEQENADTARKYGGSGLGLSIVHNLVTLMDGTIDVSSRQNEGTCFTVRLHFSRAEEHRGAAAARESAAGLRVLIVSDSEWQAESMQAALEEIGVRTDVVGGGAYAAKRIRRRRTSDYPYRLCLMDWESLKDDPAMVASQIRAESGREELALMAVGFDVAGFEDSARAAGVDSCMRLPVFRSGWLRLMVNLCEGVSDPVQREKKRASEVLRGKRVLLAEDNAFNLEIAVTVLRKAELEVDTAEDGKRALEMYAATPAGSYDLILMDVQMPVMDGYAATRAIRASGHADAHSIPIIAMTANAFAEDVARAMESGMNAHIAKPVDYDKLFDILEKIAAPKQPGGPA